MKNRIIYILALISVILGTTSCEKDIDAAYKEGERIYFEYLYQDPNYYGTRLIVRDSILVSLGKLDNSVTTYDVKVPVLVLGDPLSSDKRFKVTVANEGEVVKGSTTAVENQHYKPLENDYTFHAGLYSDTIVVTLLRNNLSTSYNKREYKNLILRLVETDDLKLGLRDGWEVKISVNNYIDEPSWWNVYGLGFYHPEKYKILLMFGTEELYSSIDILNNGSRYINAMKNYLNDNVVIDEETGKRVTFSGLVDID